MADPIELIGGTRAPHHQHLFLWPCLLSLLESRGGFYLGEGTQAPGTPCWPGDPSSLGPSQAG